MQRHEARRFLLSASENYFDLCEQTLRPNNTERKEFKVLQLWKLPPRHETKKFLVCVAHVSKLFLSPACTSRTLGYGKFCK